MAEGKKWTGAISVVVPIAVLYIAFGLAGIGCPIKFFTGVSCAGCGMTRAWMELLRLNIAAAFFYHPLFFLPPLCAAAFFAETKLSRRARTNVLLTVAVIFVIVYLYRLLLDKNDIVVFEPQNGVIFKVAKWAGSYF